MKARFAAAAICILAGHLLAQPNKGAPKDKNKPADHTENTVTLKDNQESAHKTETPKTSPPHWYASFEEPDWWLVVIAAATGFAIAYQAREMKRATVEMKKSADAANKSAEAWMAGERAWILAEVHDIKITMHPEHPLPILTSFDLHLVNHGRTPGRITRTSGWLDAVEDLESLALTPDYRNITTSEKYPIPVVTGKAHVMMTAFNDHFLKEKGALIGQGEAIQCVYGFVEYVDIFDAPHETRFCFKYSVTQPPGKPLSHGMTRWGHPEYNRAT